MDTTDKLIKLLNEAHRLDPFWVTKLVEYRPFCNQAIADHPRIQVKGYSHSPNITIEPMIDPYTSGMLGLINGLFEDPGDRVAVIIDELDNNKVVGFCRYTNE